MYLYLCCGPELPDRTGIPRPPGHEGVTMKKENKKSIKIIKATNVISNALKPFLAGLIGEFPPFSNMRKWSGHTVLGLLAVCVLWGMALYRSTRRCFQYSNGSKSLQ